MMVLPRLYAVADRTFGQPLELAKALFEGGARLVQVRDKQATDRELLATVEDIIRAAPTDARIIVNDRPDIARIAGAYGAHLGQEDLHPNEARRVLAEGQIVGYSTHDLSQAVAAESTEADYVAVGPVFPTGTKENAQPVVGLRRLSEICSRVRKPVVAIGGIRLESVRDVLDCGAASIAVISDLLGKGDVVRRTREWLSQIESIRGAKP
jgi:thiamine-phosphate pyrophosphorylase